MHRDGKICRRRRRLAGSFRSIGSHETGEAIVTIDRGSTDALHVESHAWIAAGECVVADLVYLYAIEINRDEVAHDGRLDDVTVFHAILRAAVSIQLCEAPQRSIPANDLCISTRGFRAAEVYFITGCSVRRDRTA